MLRKETGTNTKQIEMVSIDELVPQDHLLRKINNYIDFDFIYDLVEDLYSPDNGRPSVDPVLLIKLTLIQYLFGIGSMRQTIKEVEVNLAYRWFLGLSSTIKCHTSPPSAKTTPDASKTQTFSKISSTAS